MALDGNEDHDQARSKAMLLNQSEYLTRHRGLEAMLPVDSPWINKFNH